MVSEIAIPYESYALADAIESSPQAPTLHFAHANAYPPGSYRQLLNNLSEDFHVLAIKYRPLWPASNPEEISGWQDIAQDLIMFLDQMTVSGIIGVGHSLGAVTTMMAAIQRPDLFNSLVLIEPVFLPPAVLAHFNHRERFDPYQMPLIKVAQKRRRHWNSRQEAFDHFREKSVFTRWSDQALWDYINAGLITDKHGDFELAYPPEWEAWIYAHPPTTVWDLIPQVTRHTLAIRGVESDTLTPESWKSWAEKQPDATFNEVPESGHLVPMEKPATVARLIGGFIQALR